MNVQKCRLFVKTPSVPVVMFNFSFITKPSITSRRDSIKEPKCPYKMQPWNQGKIIWIAGTPGSGKSTVAQQIAKQKGMSCH